MRGEVTMPHISAEIQAAIEALEEAIRGFRQWDDRKGPLFFVIPTSPDEEIYMSLGGVEIPGLDPRVMAGLVALRDDGVHICVNKAHNDHDINRAFQHLKTEFTMFERNTRRDAFFALIPLQDEGPVTMYFSGTPMPVSMSITDFVESAMFNRQTEAKKAAV